MNQSHSILITLVLIVASGGLLVLAPGSGILIAPPQQAPLQETKIIEQQSLPSRLLPQRNDLIKEDSPTEPVEETSQPTESVVSATLDHDVPFHAQAPLGNWNDPYQANGCEETSLLMVSWYYNNVTVTAKEAIDEIHRISGVAKELFGEFRDVSTRDTITMGRAAFPDLSFVLVENPTIAQIKGALDKGKLVIVPTDGTVATNPYYTGAGPEYHMVVVRGYDEERGVFITNDPGTKRGDALEYTYENLMEGIGDYPTGYHEILPPEREKLAIIVSG